MKIRQANQADAESLSTLMLHLGYQVTPSQIATMITSANKHEDDVYVCILEDDVIAMISLIYFDYFPGALQLCRITALVVDEAFRGHGCGTALIKQAKASAKAKGCSALELTTALHRHNTHDYYEHLGFDKTSYKFVLTLDKPD